VRFKVTEGTPDHTGEDYSASVAEALQRRRSVPAGDVKQVLAVEEHPVQNPTPVMDRAEVERIAYQAIGHQFRLPSLFSMLLLVVGFVLGHYVASRHTAEIAARFEARINSLQEKVDSLYPGVTVSQHGPAPAALTGTLASEPVSAPEERATSPFDASDSNFQLTGMSRTFETTATDFAMLSATFLGDVEATTTTTRAVIDGLRKAAQDERDACLAELQPYVDRKLSVPATTVAHVIETIYSDQDSRLVAAIDDAAAKATGLDPRDTSVKIFPPMSEDGEEAESPEKPAELPVNHRYFPRPSSSRSLFFSPVGTRVPVPATSAIDTESVVR